MSGEPEPRRSVRATKGQHTKPFDQLDPLDMPKKRQVKRQKKSTQDEKQDEPEEEVIRCVCGATEQDEDSGEPWIACDTCGAWQHNVCMGMSRFNEDLPKHYYCEKCSPQDHTELLEGIARGEKPWEARRLAYEEETKKRKGKRGKGKRNSDSKEDSTPADSKKEKEKGKEKERKEGPGKPTGPKRKSRDESQEQDSSPSGPAQKLRKVSETSAVPVHYEPPADLANNVNELPESRQGPVKLLMKSLHHALGSLVKQNDVVLPEETTVDTKSASLALQIERAVFDSHPTQKDYISQCRTLAFNLKSNEELTLGLMRRSLSPNGLAVMTTDELASKELQRETAEMKARAEKQSILISEEGPRVRRTHKGDEVIENDNILASEDTSSFIRRPSVRESNDAARESSQVTESQPQSPAAFGPKGDKQGSPTNADFDIKQVFSSVKSPTVGQHQRPSILTGPYSGPGVDADVDRLLQDDNESPPYSPTEDADPDIVWRGGLFMNSLADMQITAKYLAGANLSSIAGLSWTRLIPKRLSVAGRIDEDKAIEYLCSLRYSDATDVIVVGFAPASESYKAEFQSVVDYFVSKHRYGVIGDKGVGHVRDTYLVPVLPGEGNLPEFLLNLTDNLVPNTRTEPLLLGVFVYRDDSRLSSAVAANLPVSNNGTKLPLGMPPNANISTGPAFSPTVPQGPFPPTAPAGAKLSPEQELQRAQRAGQALAAEVLGPLLSSPTVQFLLPQAYQMSRREWEVVRRIFESDPLARNDLQHLSALLEKASNSVTKTEG